MNNNLFTEKIGVIVQARMGSTRLPGKVMLPIMGESMLEILIKRLQRLRYADAVIIATTMDPKDDVIVKRGNKAGVFFYRGDENDVLQRYYEAAKQNGLDVIVRITSDCPFSDPDLIDALIMTFLQKKVDYLSNTLVRTYPRGFDIEVFSFKALELAHLNASLSYQREHVTPYIYENLNHASFIGDEDSSPFRVTVDTPEDFKLVKLIFEELKNLPFIYCQDVVSLIKARPDLMRINKEIKQKGLKA